MAGFFYLGGGGGSGREESRKQVDRGEEQQGLFLYKNEEIYNKGFEIWPEYYHLHHQAVNSSSYSTFGAGPSRRNLNFSDELSSRSASFTAMRSQGLGGGGVNCQDCGNQGKKDCAYMRCRTCCRSRGFECPTHVKSTWVPAAKRRERQQQLATLQKQQQEEESQQLQVENVKRHRDYDDQGLDMVQFPNEVNSPALFRCVRISGVDDAEEAYAYQTAVNIGGHVFKGILYDHGPSDAGEASPGKGGGARGTSSTQQLDLIMAADQANNTCADADADATTSNAAALLDHSLYPAQLNAFMAGTQFFPSSRP